MTSPQVVPTPSDPNSTATQISRVFELSDLRPSTRRTYELAVKGFLTWNGTRALGPSTLIEYKNALLLRSDLSAKTKNLYLSAVRTVVRRLFELGILEVDLSKTVRSLTISSKHKHTPISDSQVRHALSYVAGTGDTRLVLLFNLLYRQGLRQKEIADLRVEHFDAASLTITVLGKGQDDREAVNLHPETVDAIRRHIEVGSIKSGFLFPSRKGRSAHISTNMLYRIVRQVHSRCGIANSPHAWRKVFTSKLIEGGMNLLDVQSYTRHRSVGQLKVYYDRLSFAKTLPEYYRAFQP